VAARHATSTATTVVSADRNFIGVLLRGSRAS
jgi:hypothetical protein